MKITGIRPEIIAKDTTSVIKLFEELGFEKAHTKADIEGHSDYKNDTLKNADGEMIHVTQVPDMPHDVTSISVNVDNIEEAIKICEANGFKSIDGKITHTGTSKAMTLVSSTGLMISLCEHTN